MSNKNLYFSPVDNWSIEIDVGFYHIDPLRISELNERNCAEVCANGNNGCENMPSKCLFCINTDDGSC